MLTTINSVLPSEVATYVATKAIPFVKIATQTRVSVPVVESKNGVIDNSISKFAIINRVALIPQLNRIFVAVVGRATKTIQFKSKLVCIPNRMLTGRVNTIAQHDVKANTGAVHENGAIAKSNNVSVAKSSVKLEESCNTITNPNRQLMSLRHIRIVGLHIVLPLAKRPCDRPLCFVGSTPIPASLNLESNYECFHQLVKSGSWTSLLTTNQSLSFAFNFSARFCMPTSCLYWQVDFIALKITYSPTLSELSMSTNGQYHIVDCFS